MGVYLYTNEWLPWENTVAYYPLNSTTTVNDQSWNNRNLTNHSVSFNTYDGVDCAYFNWSSQYLDETTINWGLINWNLTISFWCKVTAWALNSIWYWKPYNWTLVLYNNLTSIYCDTSNNNNNTTHTTFSTSSLNVWNLITITWTWNTYTVYSNWTLSWSMTTSIPTSWNSHFYLWCVGNDVDWLRAYMTWHLSNYIIENKVWTADEISNYYNTLKSKYWIS